MTAVRARSIASTDSGFAPNLIERREPGPHDIVIDIAYAGICHSDIHTARGEWGAVIFPLVPGHEIAGIISTVGDQVTNFAVGDRAGVGCFVDSCRTCENCLAGEEQYCRTGAVLTYNALGKDGLPTHGGYSQQLVVDENYAVRIPESMDLAAAAPLLCAGITMYSPLRHWQAGPGKQVAIVGLGGLGHVGVKIAAAMGAEITVLSQSLKKQEDGLRMGASAYYATSDPETFRTLRNRFDLIVSTLSANVDINGYLNTLRLNGSLVNVGLPEQPLSVSAMRLISARRSLSGSTIGGIRETQEMLDFCAEHQIAADVEIIDADYIDQAYERVVASDVRYRFVIDAATI